MQFAVNTPLPLAEGRQIYIAITSAVRPDLLGQTIKNEEVSYLV